MITSMRRLAVYLTLALLLAVSFAIGWVLSDAPRYCAQLGWCAGQAARH
jgi:hypothetical protein